MQAGAKEVSLMEAPMAAAIGLGLPVQDPVGSAVAVLGAGASEAALISLGGIVTSGSRRVGGADVESTLATLLRLRHGVVVSPRTLEELKISMGSARLRTITQVPIVAARTVERGVIVDVAVDAGLVNEALSDVVQSTVKLIQECLADAPPDLSQDISQQGLTLVGGHAQLADFAELLSLSTGIDVRVADDPATVIIRGLELCLEEMSSLHSLLRTADR
jgi:rod shape-determining protein MreB